MRALAPVAQLHRASDFADEERGYALLRARGMRAPLAAAAVFFLAMGALSVARYATFHSATIDMAYYVRLVWGLANGHFDQPIVGASHFLGLHLEPMLFVFALLARWSWPIAETLLVAQAACAAAAIFPAAAMARRHLAAHVGERAAFAAALSIYLVPTVSRCVDFDFHPSTMAILPLMALVNALDAGRWRSAWAWFVAALMCREDVGLQGACVAATLAFWPRAQDERRQAAAMALFGAAWFVVYTLVVQPRFLPGRGSFDLHFGWLGLEGRGLGGVLQAALGSPGRLVDRMLTVDRAVYPLLLVGQVALLPLFGLRWLVGAAPLVAINVLSDFPGVRDLEAHYITAAAPFIVGAAWCGAGRMLKRRWPLTPAVPWVLLACAGVAFLLRGASPFSPEWRWSHYRASERTAWIQTVVDGTPPTAEVHAPLEVLAHFAERPVVRVAPRGARPRILLPVPEAAAAVNREPPPAVARTKGSPTKRAREPVKARRAMPEGT